jgi:ATP-binding cassette subfamily B protein
LQDARGELGFDNVTFNYRVDDSKLLKDVKRYGRMEDVGAVLSLATSIGKGNGKKKVEHPAAGGDEEPVSDSGTSEATSQAREVALEGVSFIARPGQLIALVGPSGAGKTTMTYLIPRLYDPTDGVIRIEGHDLRDVTLDSLAAAIGMVTQETYLFHDTIRTNLTYAKMDATQPEIEAAARAANIHQFIMDS